MAKKDHLWKCVGITTRPDQGTKVRTGGDYVANTKRANKGATRCDFVELPYPMLKLDAINFLKEHPDFQSPADQATIQDAIDYRMPKEKKSHAKIDSLKSRKRELSAVDILKLVKQ